MRLTKGMKKALSVLLSGAMVITGVNVTTGTAQAAGTASDTLKWTGTATADGDYMSVESEQGSTLTVEQYTDQDWANYICSIPLENVDLSIFSDPQITIVFTTSNFNYDVGCAVMDKDWGDLVGYSTDPWEDSYDAEKQVASTETTLSGSIGSETEQLIVKISGRTLTEVYIHEKDIDPLDASAGEDATEAPGGNQPTADAGITATTKPTDDDIILKWTGTAEFGRYVDPIDNDWENPKWNDGETVQITTGSMSIL